MTVGADHWGEIAFLNKYKIFEIVVCSERVILLLVTTIQLVINLCYCYATSAQCSVILSIVLPSGK